MSANASEGRISMTVQSIMADNPDPPTPTTQQTPSTAPPDARTREPAGSISTAPTPSSNVSQPSPSSGTPTEPPPRKKRPLPEGRPADDDGKSESQASEPSRRKRPLPEGRLDDGPTLSEPPESSRKKRTLPEGRPMPASYQAQFPVATGTPRARPSQQPITLESSPAVEESVLQPVSRASPEVEIAEIEGQYFDTTSSLTFLHRAWKRDKPFASATHESHPLPERSVGLEMMRFYFDVCVVTYRCLHQGYVVEWFNVLLTNALDNVPLHRDIGHAKASIVLTILAIVTLRKIKVRGTEPSPDEASELRRSDSYFCRATGLTDQETGLPKLESAQARLLQTLYLLQTSRMNQAWYTFGSVLPIVSALGLHRKASRKRASNGQAPPVDYITSQCRKRTFWVAYTIDKYLAVVFGRPRMYHDEDIDQDFPDCVNDEDMTPQGRSSDEPEMDCHVESLIFHAKLAQLIDGISREVYSIKPIPKHDRLLAAHRYGRALHEWRESLPHHLGTVRPMSLIPSFRRQNTALKLAYCHAIMHANRPFLLGTTTSRGDSQPSALDDSVEECINAAKTALETVDAMASDGTLFHAFWWTPYVTFCALAVVYVWKIQRVGDDEDKGLFELADRCQNHLAKATTSDSPSRRYSVILEELREEAKGPEARQRGPEQGATSEQAESGQAADLMQVDDSSGLGVAQSGDMGAVFQTQGFEGMTNFLAGWETTDWLDLDSSVYRYLRAF
ncbi:hypothetical protein K4K60_009751 [Colletotrichum sp. SAR11_57]|nr:hypothetical protein K4K60_009751 [Colletotrichum sp. SAR11_57]